jgi:hypothetical protein
MICHCFVHMHAYTFEQYIQYNSLINIIPQIMNMFARVKLKY